MRIIPILLTIILLSSPVFALVKEGADSRGKYFIEDRKNYPIIFLPGVAGSELYCKDSNAWPGWLTQRITGGNFDKLYIDDKGKQACNIVPLRSIRGGLEFDLSFLGVWHLFDVYDPFFDYMDNDGYSLEENKESGLRYYDFAYDWRMDNHRTAELLDDQIDKALKENKADKVILYAHSMGGVVAKLYMNDPKNAKKVAAVVFMGTPHHGSPMPYYAYTNGYNFGNSKLSDTTMWELMGNWQAGYQLIPSYSFIQDSESGEFWPMEKIYGTSWISEQEYSHYLDDPNNYKIRYGLPNQKYAKEVIAFQEELGDTLPQYEDVEYDLIEGVAQDTVQYFIGTLEWKDDIDFGDAPKRPVLKLEKVITKQGDGTVPARGAEIKGLTSHATVEADHGSIPSNTVTQSILTSLRKGILNEEKRAADVIALNAYTKEKLKDVQSWPSSGSVFAALKSGIFSFFKPDEEKIKVREELRGTAKEMLNWAHINVIIAKGTPEEEHFYVIINEFELVESGPGSIRPGTAIVEIDTKQKFDDIINNRQSISAAIDDKTLRFKGVGIVNSFKLKLFSWFGKYGM